MSDQETLKDRRKIPSRMIINIVAAVMTVGVLFGINHFYKSRSITDSDVRNAEQMIEQTYKSAGNIMSAKANFFVDKDGDLRGWMERRFVDGTMSVVTCNGSKGDTGKVIVTCAD